MTGQRPIIIVTGRNRPHEVMLFASSIVLFGAWAVGSPMPASLLAVPQVAVAAWFILQGVAGPLGLFAVFAPSHRRVQGLRLERAANLLEASAGAFYVPAVISLGGWRSLVVATFVGLVWVVGSLWRVVQITGDLRDLREVSGP